MIHPVYVAVQYLYAHVLWKKICWDFKIGMIYFRRRICDFSVWNIFTLAQRERERKKLSKIRSQSRKNMISFSSSPPLSQFCDIVFNLESQNSGSIDRSPFLSAMRPTWIKHGKRKSSFLGGCLYGFDRLRDVSRYFFSDHSFTK